MAKNKRLAAAAAQVDRAKSYSLDEAIRLVKSTSKAKFDETVEMSMNLGIDPRHADQMVRGLTSLPNGTGKSVRVAVFTSGKNQEAAKAAGADIVGLEDLAEPVKAEAKADAKAAPAAKTEAKADAKAEAKKGDKK